MDFFRHVCCGILITATLAFAGRDLHAQATRTASDPSASGTVADSSPAAIENTGPAQSQAAAEEGTGFWDVIVQSGWIGMAILLALLIGSLTAGYLVVDHFLTVRAAELNPPDLAEQVTGLLTQGRVAEAEQLCRQRPSFLAFVLINGLTELPAGWGAMEKAMEDATAEQAARLLRKVEYLSVIGNIAPMMGLLGTVTGMIIAFQEVATSQGTAGAADLAEGIYQALITTVAGLLVAIPSLAAFAVCRNRVDQLVAEVAYTAQHVFTPWRRRRMRGSSTPPVATPVPPVPIPPASEQR